MGDEDSFFVFQKFKITLEDVFKGAEADQVQFQRMNFQVPQMVAWSFQMDLNSVVIGLD